MTDRITSAAARHVSGVIIVVASSIALTATHSAAQLAELQAKSADSRPKALCLETYEAHGAKTRITCFIRGLDIVSPANSKSFEEQQRELRKELQRRADERRRKSTAPPLTPADD